MNTITTGANERPVLPPQTKLAYNRRECAAQLGVSVRAVDYAIAAGELNVRRIGCRIIITHEELLRFLKRDHPGRVQ